LGDSLCGDRVAGNGGRVMDDERLKHIQQIAYGMIFGAGNSDARRCDGTDLWDVCNALREARGVGEQCVAHLLGERESHAALVAAARRVVNPDATARQRVMNLDYLAALVDEKNGETHA